MKSQLDLFADPRPPLPPTGWADTSKAAAHAIREHASTIRARVLAHITGQGAHGATIEEIADRLKLKQATVCGRIGELARPPRGQPALIVDSGQGRKTTSGVAAKVWVATGVDR